MTEAHAGNDAPVLRLLRGRRSWRIGLPSFLIPAGYAENVRYVATAAEDVEILLFEPDRGTNWPSKAEMETLAALAQTHGLSYTVHLPCERDPASPSSDEREAALADLRHAIERTRGLSPHAWILHCGEPGGPATADTPPDTLCRLAGELDDPRRLCLETMGDDAARLTAWADALDCSLCLDTGHLEGAGADVPAALRAAGERLRVVHLHGVDAAGRDHRALDAMPAAALSAVLAALASFTGVLTLEVFGAAKAAASLARLAAALENFSASGRDE